MSFLSYANSMVREHGSLTLAELAFRDSEMARVERRMAENIASDPSLDISDAYAGACDEISDEIYREEECSELSEFDQHNIWNHAQLGL